MGIFTEYLSVDFVDIAPTYAVPLVLLPPNFDNPIVVSSIIVTNLGSKQPIRFTLQSWYQDTPVVSPVAGGYLVYQLLIPSLETETPDNLRSCNILQRIKIPSIHLTQGHFLSCFVESPIQKIDLRMDYTLLKNL